MTSDLRTLAEIADRLRYEGSDRERSVRRLFRKHKIQIVQRDRHTFLVSEAQYSSLLEAISPCSRSGSAANTSTSAVRSVSGAKRESSKSILAAQIAAMMPTTTKRSSKRTSGMKSFTVVEGGRTV